MTNEPSITAKLDQFIALALDVQVRMFRHRQLLVEAGWTEPEAWALTLRLEERLLGPLLGGRRRDGPDV